MKLNTHQRKLLGDRFMELGNMLAAAYVVGAIINPNIPLTKAVLVLVMVVVLYTAGLRVLPRYQGPKGKKDGQG